MSAGVCSGRWKEHSVLECFGVSDPDRCADSRVTPGLFGPQKWSSCDVLNSPVYEGEVDAGEPRDHWSQSLTELSYSRGSKSPDIYFSRKILIDNGISQRRQVPLEGREL